jgi:putative transposase
MDDYESLSHSKWECKYHVVFILKCRRKTLYGELRQHLGEVFRRLAIAEGVQSRRGTFDARSCAHDDFDPT